MSESKTFGPYTAIRGKLATDDARSAYVTGPSGDGTIRPLASFWSYAEAEAWARARGVKRCAACPMSCGVCDSKAHCPDHCGDRNAAV